ncbi:MAG: phosphate transporter substrate-binding protein PhoT family [Phycisphaerales bacterium]|nr:phosphate transporter substrate-binding protein PhoT family [Phycisphaerales bacterium]
MLTPFLTSPLKVRALRKAAAFAVAFASAAGIASADTSLKGSGATFPNPVYQRWIGEYGKANPGVKVDYASVGSGQGIKDITARTVDFAGSDAPMSKKEKADLKGPILHIPTVAGAVVPAYNLPGFTGELKLTGELLAKMYLGQVRTWNDPAVAAANPGVALPALAVTPVWRTDGSGTTFVYTNYLATQSPDFLSKVGPGKQVRFPAGVGGKGNEGVTQNVKTVPGAVGYVELNYAVENKLPFGAVRNKSGAFVKGSAEAVAAAGAAAVSKMAAPDKLAVDLWNQDGPAVYPISAFTYVLVYQDLTPLGEAKAKELVRFLTWATGPDAGKIAADMTYAPLDPAVRAKVDEAMKTLTLNGKPVAGGM